MLDIAEDKLELLRGGAGERARRVGLGLNHIAGLPEQQRERLPDFGVVLNDQQPHRFHPSLVENSWNTTPPWLAMVRPALALHNPRAFRTIRGRVDGLQTPPGTACCSPGA